MDNRAMTEATKLRRPAGVGRLGTAAAWISAICCLPYLFLKLVWTLDIPVGITDRSVLHGGGWVAGNALMAGIELAGLLLVLALTRPWARRVPAWLLLFPAWVGTGLLFQVVLGAALTVLFSASSHTSNVDTGGIAAWVFVVVYATFAGQGVALAIAFGCYVRARWSRLLAQPTRDVVAKRAVRVRSWPENHLTEIAEAVAAMAVAVALVCVYWAAGGSFGPSGTQPNPSSAMQISRAAGAIAAAVGLLALAGRWGRETRFWLPAALTWIGSGALAAFDGLWYLLFLILGPDAPDAGWSLTDTVVAIKVLTGAVAAAVGLFAVTATTSNDETSTPTPHHPRPEGSVRS
jgi:hypothetical protein